MREKRISVSEGVGCAVRTPGRLSSPKPAFTGRDFSLPTLGRKGCHHVIRYFSASRRAAGGSSAVATRLCLCGWLHCPWRAGESSTRVVCPARPTSNPTATHAITHSLAAGRGCTRQADCCGATPANPSRQPLLSRSAGYALRNRNASEQRANVFGEVLLRVNL